MRVYAKDKRLIKRYLDILIKDSKGLVKKIKKFQIISKIKFKSKSKNSKDEEVIIILKTIKTSFVIVIRKERFYKNETKGIRKYLSLIEENMEEIIYLKKECKLVEIYKDLEEHLNR